jgi:cytochrome c5
MRVLYRSLLAIALFGLAACSTGDDEAAAEPSAMSPEQREVKPTWREDRLALGVQTYQAACASCHETGDQDAPITGNREQWEQRSDMWQAVLFNHAKAGYLQMPGKGGQLELTDDAVEAATEYMLGLTFPELPRD